MDNRGRLTAQFVFGEGSQCPQINQWRSKVGAVSRCAWGGHCSSLASRCRFFHAGGETPNRSRDNRQSNAGLFYLKEKDEKHCEREEIHVNLFLQKIYSGQFNISAVIISGCGVLIFHTTPSCSIAPGPKSHCFARSSHCYCFKRRNLHILFVLTFNTHHLFMCARRARCALQVGGASK